MDYVTTMIEIVERDIWYQIKEMRENRFLSKTVKRPNTKQNGTTQKQMKIRQKNFTENNIAYLFLAVIYNLLLLLVYVQRELISGRGVRLAQSSPFSMIM